MFETRVTRMLGIKYPIVGGIMMSITDADFVAAVCNAGGWAYLPPSYTGRSLGML